MKKFIVLYIYILSGTIFSFAYFPPGYYDSADKKQYLDLKNGLNTIITNHKVFNYTSLWDYYPYTYYVIDNTNQVLDLYSNNITYFSNTTTMNKEHTVPKSWWGGSTSIGPGCDIINVIPSEQKANSAKSNYPLGIVSGSPTFDNGVTKIGPSGVSGYSGNVFEPKDDYKGDFARIYFYVATCYPDLLWDTNNALAMTNKSALTLQSWIIPLLLDWNSKDPVDNAEVQRNEDIFKQQQNRNPFIDYPALADYIWGAKQNEIFVFSEHPLNQGSETSFKTKIPTFSVEYGTDISPKNIADNSTITIKAGTASSILYSRLNEGQWSISEPTKGWNTITQSEYDIPASIDYNINGNTRLDAFCLLDGYENSDTINAFYNGVTFSNDYLLYEAFDEITSGNNTSNTGSSTPWTGNANFPIVTSTYKAGGALRLGTSSTSGSIESKGLYTSGGDIEIEFDVKGWTTVEGDIFITITGAAKQTVTYKSIITDSFEHKKLIFSNVSANPVINISTSSKRAFIDNITVKELSTDIDVLSTTAVVKQDIYNTTGQKIDKNYKGIVITKGKKVIN